MRRTAGLTESPANLGKPTYIKSVGVTPEGCQGVCEAAHEEEDAASCAQAGRAVTLCVSKLTKTLTYDTIKGQQVASRR